MRAYENYDMTKDWIQISKCALFDLKNKNVSPPFKQKIELTD